MRYRSALLDIKYFDIKEMVLEDYLHRISLGLVKKALEFTFGIPATGRSPPRASISPLCLPTELTEIINKTYNAIDLPGELHSRPQNPSKNYIYFSGLLPISMFASIYCCPRSGARGDCKSHALLP